ncbi:MAG: MFS transporter, partial [Planctomycetes bacterium]|nr:MFS transporter [Planctomycetota bacterium]
MNSNSTWSLTTAKRAIVVAGCLAAIYTQLTTSPATIAYAKSIGANELHIGILGALPTLMLFMQFVSGVVVNHLTYRRRLWFWTTMIHRLLLLPTALGPWIFPDLRNETWVWTLIIATTLNQALLHFSSPLWLSWMGDYLPHQGLSHFWGNRHFWMQITAATSLCAAAFLLMKSGFEIDVGFSILTIVGVACGVADLLLFFRVHEPPVCRVPSPKLTTVLAAPFRNKNFRRYIRFMCYWNFAAMVGSPFISLYLFSEVGLDLFRVMLLSAISWVGGAMFSRWLGKLADLYGTRPVLEMCMALKSSLMLAILIVPSNPNMVFWFLAPFYMLDAVLNVGILIANDGFMIKNSPSENRTMYIAATQALAGVVGGVTSIGVGWLMMSFSDFHTTLAGWSVGHFQIVFLSSFILRLTALILIRTVSEPNSYRTMDMIAEVAESILWSTRSARDRLFRELREDSSSKTSIEAHPVAVPTVPLDSSTQLEISGSFN